LETNVNAETMSQAATKLTAETCCKNQCDINKSNLTDILHETITSNLKSTIKFKANLKPTITSNLKPIL